MKLVRETKYKDGVMRVYESRTTLFVEMIFIFEKE